MSMLFLNLLIVVVKEMWVLLLILFFVVNVVIEYFLNNNLSYTRILYFKLYFIIKTHLSLLVEDVYLFS